TDKLLHAANEWFTLEAIAKEGKVMTLVNGEVTANHALNPAKDAKAEHIGLQLHPVGTTVPEFRKIETKRLAGTDDQPKKDDRSVPKRIEGLENKDAVMRKQAAEALERVGAGATKAVPALVLALKDKEEGVREAALAALLAIDPDNKAA